MPTEEMKELCKKKRKALDNSGRFNAPPAWRRRTQAHVPTQGAQKLLEPEPAPPPITESASTPPVPTQTPLTSSIVHVLSSRQERSNRTASRDDVKKIICKMHLTNLGVLRPHEVHDTVDFDKYRFYLTDLDQIFRKWRQWINAHFGNAPSLQGTLRGRNQLGHLFVRTECGLCGFLRSDPFLFVGLCREGFDRVAFAPVCLRVSSTCVTLCSTVAFLFPY